jgi:hypothetical protein
MPLTSMCEIHTDVWWLCRPRHRPARIAGHVHRRERPAGPTIEYQNGRRNCGPSAEMTTAAKVVPNTVNVLTHRTVLIPKNSTAANKTRSTDAVPKRTRPARHRHRILRSLHNQVLGFGQLAAGEIVLEHPRDFGGTCHILNPTSTRGNPGCRLRIVSRRCRAAG